VKTVSAVIAAAMKSIDIFLISKLQALSASVLVVRDSANILIFRHISQAACHFPVIIYPPETKSGFYLLLDFGNCAGIAERSSIFLYHGTCHPAIVPNQQIDP
jgi:hypothetical protein